MNKKIIPELFDSGRVIDFGDISLPPERNIITNEESEEIKKTFGDISGPTLVIPLNSESLFSDVVGQEFLVIGVNRSSLPNNKTKINVSLLL